MKPDLEIDVPSALDFNALAKSPITNSALLSSLNKPYNRIYPSKGSLMKLFILSRQYYLEYVKSLDPASQLIKFDHPIDNFRVIDSTINENRVFYSNIEYYLHHRAEINEEILSKLTCNIATQLNLPGEFRQTAVYVKQDRAGVSIKYPDYDLIQPLVLSLANYMNKTHSSTSFLAVLFGIIHAHPFLDGNGRVARILAAMEICWAFYKGEQIFLPIGLIMSASLEGYIVSLRRTLYFSDWNGAVILFDNMLEGLEQSTTGFLI